jgi:hypothetical protein
MSMTVTFQRSRRQWRKDDEYYCPNCGKSGIWFEVGSGDYYEGVDHICLSCEHYFTVPTLKQISTKDTDLYRVTLNKLRTAQ